MQVIEFIQDLAVIMLIGGFVSVLFHRIKQPVVLGYIIAGLIIGPYTPPFKLIHNQEIIDTLAELGIVFLMFSLGLEFSLRKLTKVGVAASIAAIAEITLMIWLGYIIGCWFHWSTIDSIFLGGILAISSTTIIIKAINELGLQKERFVQLIFGILIIEDILAIAILAILSSIAIHGSVQINDVAITVGQLGLFILVTLILGILIVPRVLSYVGKFGNDEMLLITVLGLCFGFCLLVIKLHYSIALGAFIIGAIMAESKELKRIERLIEPLRDMFSAIFFVSVGLLLDPNIILTYALPIAVITLAVVFGKVISCSSGMFIVGQNGRTSLRVGMGIAQIGEFSFIIASLGTSLKVTSDFLYPIAVAVSVITTFLTPYLIKLADPLAKYLGKIIPAPIADVFKLYTDWLKSIRNKEEEAPVSAIIYRCLLHVFINLALVTAIFILGTYFENSEAGNYVIKITSDPIGKTLIWGGLLLLSLPFLIVTYRKIKALSMLLAERSVKESHVGKYTESVRRIISEVIPAAAIMSILFVIIILSAGILPPKELLIMVLVLAIMLMILLRRWFVRLHAKLQIALMKTMNHDKD